MNFRGVMLTLLLLVFYAVWGQAQDLLQASDPFLNENVIAVQKLHDQSVAGDKTATDLLIATLESLIQFEPENQLYHAYMGSAYTLKSRDTFPGPSKLRFLKEGLKGMDSAVKKDPHSCSVRFIRAINNYYLPAFINRRDNARKDFEILLKQTKTTPEHLNNRTLQAIYYYAGLSFKQTERRQEARDTWITGINMQANTVLAQKMYKELSKL